MDSPSVVDIITVSSGLSDVQSRQLKEAWLRDGLCLQDGLEHIGAGDEDGALRVLANHLGLTLISSEDYPDKPVFLEGVSLGFLRRHAVLPVHVDQDLVRVAVADPLQLSLLEILRSYFGGVELEVVLGRREDIRRAVDRLYGAAADKDQEQAGKDQSLADLGDGSEDDWERLKGMAQEAPIIRLVNMLISRALDMRASDIHFEPFKNDFKVRCRVDGELFKLDDPPRKMQAAIISRLKLMAGLNIAERRLPQDGRITLKFGSRQVDIRVSTVPTLHGESVVLRLLSQESRGYDLTALGLEPRMHQAVLDLIEVPHGIILVTGPTGSGKTTTLYAMLQRLNSPSAKIITVEDPVEYQIDGINQIQVKPQINLTFAGALRSLVRQDPDILLIGEIRDQETAGIAIESALTGHLVLSTLHTNDAPGAITRLRDLGIESFLIADSMVGIMAQRLVRRLCDECKVPVVAREADRARIQAAVRDLPKELTLFQAKGCQKCGLTGYRGRLAIFELLRVGEEVRSAVVAGADAGKIAFIAREQGYAPLVVDGFSKVLAGETALSEVLRATTFL